MLSGPFLLPHSGQKTKQLVILLHGYGSAGGDLIDLAPHWVSVLPDAEFFAPDGLSPCESYPQGYQWFGLKELTPASIQKGLGEVRPLMQRYLLEILTERKLTPRDLAIVGFSQGGMLALDLAFSFPGLRGAVCYSGGFYPSEGLSTPSPSPEILLVHGDADTCVPYASFLDTQEQLQKRGLHPQTLTCPGLGHSINMEGIKKGGEFLTALFATRH